MQKPLNPYEFIESPIYFPPSDPKVQKFIVIITRIFSLQLQLLTPIFSLQNPRVSGKSRSDLPTQETELDGTGDFHYLGHTRFSPIHSQTLEGNLIFSFQLSILFSIFFCRKKVVLFLFPFFSLRFDDKAFSYSLSLVPFYMPKHLRLQIYGMQQLRLPLFPITIT